MTLLPDASIGFGLPRPVRAVLFWLLMLLVAVVVWKLVAPSGGTAKPREAINYSDFMQQVERRNVATAKIYNSETTAEILGQFRQPAGDFAVTIPKESVQSVTGQLRNQGAAVQVVASASWTGFVINLLPFLLLVAIWIYVLRPRKRAPPQPPTMGEPQNRPIG
jgi:cell division protease FtsH